MAITLLPTPPSRQDPINFNVRADEFLGALPTFGTEANSLATDVNNKQVTASNAATTATTKAGEAATSATNAANSATAADNSKTAAATSETNAANSATAAATSATNASNSAAAAATSETNAATSATNASNSATAAATSETNAEIFATQQLKATSTTSNTPGLGDKSFTIETSKAFVIGMYLSITSSGASVNRMSGLVKSYNPATGALVVTVDASTGSAARTDWVIGVAGTPGASVLGLPSIIVTADTICSVGFEYLVNASGIKLTLPTSWVAGDQIAITELISNSLYSIDFGTTPLRKVTQGLKSITAYRASTGILTYENSTIGLR